jgi:BirA family transcriptional regulator, biotin operon repressor / biotin---[acetyl-CoA-carboxylase] ligase
VASDVDPVLGPSMTGALNGSGHGDRPWAAASAAAPVVAVLTATRFIHRLELREQVTSTQDEALALAARGAAAGTVVIAERQTAGRGRGGRPWEDEPSPGRSLALTVLLDVPERAAPLVPHATGLALREATSEVLVLAASAAGAAPRLEPVSSPGLKWPNDLVIRVRHAEGSHPSWPEPAADGTILRKLAGVLVERDKVAGRDVLLVGVGLNVDLRGPDAPDARVGLAELIGPGVDPALLRQMLLAALLRSLDSRLAAAAPGDLDLLEAYRGACDTLGRAVRIERPGLPILLGRAIAVDDVGRLVVLSDGGHRTTVVAGTVRDVPRAA